jgi:hypothetical protein
VNVVPAEAAVDIDVRITNNEEGGANYENDPWIATLPGWRDPPDSWRHQSSAHGTNPGYGSTFEVARKVGEEIGIQIAEGSTGGASDGNSLRRSEFQRWTVLDPSEMERILLMNSSTLPRCRNAQRWWPD